MCTKKKLKKINLDLEIENEKDIVNTDIITRQIPKSGIKVKEKKAREMGAGV